MSRNKKRIIIISIITLIVILILLISTKVINNRKVNKNALNEVVYKDNLTYAFNTKVMLSELIKKMPGKLEKDYLIDTTKLGKQNIKYTYLDSNNHKVKMSVDINIIDINPPVIWLGSSYTVNTSFEDELLDYIMCADDTDDHPKCEIIGDYNTKEVGNYSLKIIATDKSNNVTEKSFILNVIKPVTNGNNNGGGNTVTTPLKEAFDNYKKKDTKIGIDVSSWQGDIDFERVKNAGVEFVFIRIGGTKGIDKEYFMDKKFEQNIKGFNKVGIPVGIYFYSYAKTQQAAIDDANWVLKQIKDYKVDLPIVYDWENWSFYNAFGNSFYTLTNNANSFMSTIDKAGYQGMLYSSKTYLDKIWLDTNHPIWVAQYTNSILDYRGVYDYIQIADNGVVDGINGFVDLDVMYIK